MQLFIQALLVITCVAGTCCQEITFVNTDVGGITGGRFYIDGTIGGNVTELVQQNWQPFIIIQLKRITYPRFATFCVLVISGAACTSDGVKCHCLYNTTTDNIHFVINGTATPEQYSATIRAQWQHQNSTNVYSNINYTVPEPKFEDTTSASPAPEDNNALIVFLCVIIPLVVIALVIGIVWYFKAEPKPSKSASKDAAVSNHRMGSRMGSTTKTVESEQSEVYAPPVYNHGKGSTTSTVESEV
ncbi:hypothetical protein BsWGS_16925 [Bradybaena similaris]